MKEKFNKQTTDTRDIWSVSEINQRLKTTIAGRFPLVWVEGEISNLARPASGHIYFSLKDKTAQLRCVMFRGNNSRVPFEIKNGLQVVIRASASVYEARGDLQLIVEKMEEAGFGELQRQFEALKKKLHAEGLFDDRKKKTIPAFPEHIAIITSATGAAIKDYIQVAQRRYACCKKTIYSVAVQGDQAPEQIIKAIEIINKTANVDLIVLIRGGGSIEDLWCFNDEGLARVMADSNIPLVTGIGHEIDYTIADFVADLRAPTPSVAAELTCPDTNLLLSSLLRTQQQIKRNAIEIIQTLSQRVDWLSQRVKRNHPSANVSSQKQLLLSLLVKLERAIRSKLRDNHYRINTLSQRHELLSPSHRLSEHNVYITELNKRLTHCMKSLYSQKSYRLQMSTSTMQAVSPLNTLQRGYSITTHGKSINKVIRSTEELNPGDQITTYLAKGEIVSRVEETRSKQFIKPSSEHDHTDD